MEYQGFVVDVFERDPANGGQNFHDQAEGL